MNGRVILVVKLIMIASALVCCGTDDSQSYWRIGTTSQPGIFWDIETTTYYPDLAFELTMLPAYTRNPRSNLIPVSVTSAKYIPLAKDQTYFSTTDQVGKSTTENVILVAKSETGLENSSTDTTTNSNVDKNGISSCQDIQTKQFDFIDWKNLTDLERSINVLGMVLPLGMDLVKWFHAYDYNFRNSVASVVNGNNFTSNSSENGLKPIIKAVDIVYVAPTPISNGTHISVCFIMKLKEESEEYLNATDAHPIIIKEQETLIKEFELPYLSVFVGCPANLMADCCSNKPAGDHLAVIISLTITITVIIIVIGYIHMRGLGDHGLTHPSDSPNEDVNNMPCSSRDVLYNRDMLTCPKHSQRGKRTTSFHSSGEHGGIHSVSTLQCPRHLSLVREEHRGKGKRNGGDTHMEVTFM